MAQYSRYVDGRPLVQLRATSAECPFVSVEAKNEGKRPPERYLGGARQVSVFEIGDDLNVGRRRVAIELDESRIVDIRNLSANYFEIDLGMFGVAVDEVEVTSPIFVSELLVPQSGDFEFAYPDLPQYDQRIILPLNAGKLTIGLSAIEAFATT